ncbi:hypothetical protein ES708_22471 [subsurface metagenome]
MVKSMDPVPITGTSCPTITFSGIPSNFSSSPEMLALINCLIVTSKAARARTELLVPLIPCRPIC